MVACSRPEGYVYLGFLALWLVAVHIMHSVRSRDQQLVPSQVCDGLKASRAPADVRSAPAQQLHAAFPLCVSASGQQGAPGDAPSNIACSTHLLLNSSFGTPARQPSSCLLQQQVCMQCPRLARRPLHDKYRRDLPTCLQGKG